MQRAGARDAPGQEGGSQGWIAARRAGEFSGDRESESFICVLDKATPENYEVRAVQGSLTCTFLFAKL